MLDWIHHGGDEIRRIQEITREVSFQLESACMNKLSPLEDDFLFKEFYPSVERVFPAPRPIVLFTAVEKDIVLAFSRLIGKQIHLDTKDTLKSNDSFPVSSLLHDPEIPKIDDLSGLDIDYFPIDKDTKDSRFQKASMVLILLDSSVPEIESSLRRFLRKCKDQISKVRFVLIGEPKNIQNIAALIWALARSLEKVHELPIMYFISKLDASKSCQDKNRLFKDIWDLPIRSRLSELHAMFREAKLARAHALLLSQIKSSLPAFNRQGKLDKICADLPDFIASVSQKFGFPLADFPSADFMRNAGLGKLDFNQIKKLKDSNLALVTEVIEVDIPRLKNLIPKEFSDQDLLGASHIRESNKSSFKAPDPNQYLDDFENLKPEKGLLSGTQLKEHLTKVSNLSSSDLHKIWRLADQDSDGKLSLKEYAACRELIKMTQKGRPLPNSIYLS